jgi:hypothetical protein
VSSPHHLLDDHQAQHVEVVGNHRLGDGEAINPAHRPPHRGVIAVEELADAAQRVAGVTVRQVAEYLARQHHLEALAPAPQLVGLEAIQLTDGLADLGERRGGLPEKSKQPLDRGVVVGMLDNLPGSDALQPWKGGDRAPWS